MSEAFAVAGRISLARLHARVLQRGLPTEARVYRIKGVDIWNRGVKSVVAAFISPTQRVGCERRRYRRARRSSNRVADAREIARSGTDIHGHDDSDAANTDTDDAFADSGDLLRAQRKRQFAVRPI